MAESRFVRRYTCNGDIAACEGMEQRVVPTGMAVGINEVEQHQNFSEKHFLRVAPCISVWMGMTRVQCGIAVPMYVTRFGD